MLPQLLIHSNIMLQFNRKVVLSVFLFFITSSTFFGQELFPLNEPASNIPKGVLGIRVMGETYKELSQFRNQLSFRVMYGVLPRLSVMATVGVSNHHGKNFPANLVSHTHNGNQTVYTTGDFQRGVSYPYQSNGIYVFAKYRFLSKDGTHSHFRMTAYAEGAYVKQAHDESEPNLMGDTKGYGAGLITTCLKNHFAISLASGFIIPGAYDGLSPDLSGGPMIPTKISYGRALTYNLSMGYLLLPQVYKNYDQLNVNVYLELIGKAYEAAAVTQYGNLSIPINTPLLDKGNYIDIAPGVQCIIKSNLRIDFSVRLPMISKSYARFYPMFVVGVQRYFYFKKKR
ncbi:MAG TPA: hypothetical protein PLL00_02475 [Bacteroidia bacterium]|nr:hypothetical protein [Bacteroidia bacterium]